MIDDELEVKVIKVVKDPHLSLKRFSQYMVTTELGKRRIVESSKYPGDYIPRFYEMARKVICDVFSANFEDYNVYYDEFKRQSATLRKEAMTYPNNKDAHKNRMCSADGLDQIIAMSVHLDSILSSYILNSNLSQKKSSITRNGVKIGSMADILLFENAGATQVGFMKFNFTKKVLSKQEAKAMLFVLRKYFEKQEVVLNSKACFLIDVFAWRIYIASDLDDIEEQADIACLEIVKTWDLV
ncbi:hypothetical protein D9M68_639730 [compost metagenome]